MGGRSFTPCCIFCCFFVSSDATAGYAARPQSSVYWMVAFSSNGFGTLIAIVNLIVMRGPPADVVCMLQGLSFTIADLRQRCAHAALDLRRRKHARSRIRSRTPCAMYSARCSYDDRIHSVSVSGLAGRQP